MPARWVSRATGLYGRRVTATQYRLNTVAAGQKDVDGRHEAGHDGMGCGLVLVRAVVYVLFEIDEDIHTLVAAGAAVRAGWGIGEARDML
jgi:hypothetical protein